VSVVIVRESVTSGQMSEMLAEFGDFIKLAVDLKRELLAGGGELHADCEEALLLDGSQQNET
jgi:hypothetical protein